MQNAIAALATFGFALVTGATALLVINQWEHRHAIAIPVPRRARVPVPARRPTARP